MFPRRNLKILLIFLIFCSFLLIYSLSLITTKDIVGFSINKINDYNNDELLRSNNNNANANDNKLSAALPSGQISHRFLQPYHNNHNHNNNQKQVLLQNEQSKFGNNNNNLLQDEAESKVIEDVNNYNNNNLLQESQNVENGVLRKPAIVKQAFPDTLFREDLPGEKKFSTSLQQQQQQSIVNRYNNNLNAMIHHHHQQQSRPLSHDGTTLLKIPYKLVHIDLKGAPPKLNYLKSVLETIKENGGNGILLEYEDMFPFNGGGLNGTSHTFHYSQNDINDLITTSNSLGLEIIPLVQTFGHLEFILKLERFRHLREVDDFPQEICPKNEVAWSLVTALIDQVISMHQDSQYIHIGCDEVFHIGECTRCHGKDTKELFLSHVKRVANYIYQKYQKRSIIWDDMLRRFYVEELLASDIGNHVELMIWDYTEDVDRLVSPYLWPMYGQIFPNIWIASAFKGAFGETLYIVDAQRHALNHLSWLRVLNREQHRIKNLRGFVITGWSRYDHFAVLCELLPVAIPSMILSLQLLIKQNMEDASKLLFKYLKCDPGVGGAVDVLRLDECFWNGADLYNSMKSLKFYEEQSKMLITQHRSEKGWLSDYNLKYNYTSPWRLIEPMQMASSYLTSIKTYETSLALSLKNYYQQHVVDEWIEQKLEPIINSLELLIKDCEALSKRKSWERRPPIRPPAQKIT